MRYTTLIDISEIPGIYGNHHARLLYMHLALKAGYHDEDRDLVQVSIRNLAMDCGLSVSATRHALKVLQKEKLLSRQGNAWRVFKWLVPPPPTPRTQAAAKKAAADAKSTAGISKLMEEQAREEQRIITAVRSCSRAQLEQWAQELEDGRSIKHCGVYLNANKGNVDWLREIAKGM